MIEAETIRKCFAALRVTYLKSPDATDFIVPVESRTHSFHARIRIEEGGAFLNMRTIGLPCYGTVGLADAALLRTLQDMTLGLRVVKAMLHPEDGTLVVTSEHWYAGCTVDADGFELCYRNFLAGIARVLRSIAPPADDVTGARMEC